MQEPGRRGRMRPYVHRLSLGFPFRFGVPFQVQVRLSLVV